MTYSRKFLAYWGLLLFLCKLGSRRQLDHQLRDSHSCVLDNLNRWAGTQQDSLPVHKTLDHFLGHVGASAWAELRCRCVRQLMRMRVLDAGRLQGRLVVAVDGSGFLVFHQPHCARCLTMSSGERTVYLHPVLEAKVVDPRGLALSIGTEFIENVDQPPMAAGQDYQQIKQDCELKAWPRLAAQLKAEFPQAAFCIAGDSLLACGPALRVCEQNGWAFVFSFKPGRTPALWAEFQGLLRLAPQNRLQVQGADGVSQRYRWVNDLDYEDDEGRHHRLNALLCEETVAGQTTTFAWLTSLPLRENTVIAVATKGGRNRWKIENEGFNTQKNSGLNLEHAYSWTPEHLKAFYYLLQIAHLLWQLVEKGSLLRRLAEPGQNFAAAFGSLKNLARWLLDCWRYFLLPAAAFAAPPGQIRLDGS